MFYTIRYSCPLGDLFVSSDGYSLVRIDFAHQFDISVFQKNNIAPEAFPCFFPIRSWLDAYFRGEQPPLASLPLKPIGSEFQNRVWHELVKIPYGTVVTYGEIANRVFTGQKPCAQAVGGAVGRNPLPIVIPCHRVVGKNQNLTGYHGGLDIKKWLLKHENFDLTGYHDPKTL